jgi:hypothetical protein
MLISHVQNNGMLAPLFYGVNLARLDAAGAFVDPMSPGEIVHQAVVLNQPVPLQIETVLTFLSQLIRRQRYIWQNAEQRANVNQIDRAAAELDERAQNEVVDTLRHGWRVTAETLARQASEAGLAFDATYQPDPFPDRHSVVRRLPQLRRVYNTFPTIRDALDRAISAMSGREPLVMSSGLPDLQRDYLQQLTSLMSITKYVNQSFRDAFVCGNGFLAFVAHQPLGVHSLRPDDVVVRDADHFELAQGGSTTPVGDHVIHFRGLEQIFSPYGLSLLEVFLGDLRSYDAFHQTGQFANTVLAQNPNPDQRQWAQRILALGARVAEEREARFKSLLAGAFQLPSPEAHLYFDGFETL